MRTREDAQSPLGPTVVASASNEPSIPWRLRHVTGTDRRLLARSLLTVIGRLISKFSIVIFLVIATRFLSKSQYGVYSYVLVLANTFGVLADPQISLSAGRDVSSGRRHADSAYWDAVPVVLAAGLGAAIAMIGFGLVDSGPGITIPQLLIVGLYLLFNRVFGLGTDMLRALGRFGLEATIETTGTVLLVVAASLVASSGGGVTAVLAVFLAQSVVSTVVCQLALRRDVGRPRRPTPAWRPMLRIGISLSFAASATAVATRAPLIVLGSSASAASVASYSAGLRFADAIYLLALTAGQALLPSIASLVRTDRRRAVALTRRIAAAGFLVGAVIAAATVPFGHAITTTVFGHQYGSSGRVMSILMLAVPFMAVFWISWFSLFAFGGERDVLLITLVGLAASLVACIAAIPADGQAGAAWVYTGVLALLASGSFVALERRSAGTRLHRVDRRPVALCALGVVAVLAASYGVSRLDTAQLSAVPRWGLLGVLAVGGLSGAVYAVRRNELLAPLGVVSMVVLFYFVVRPLQLSLSAGSIVHSAYNYYATPLQSVLDLRAQEITLYVDTRIAGSFGAALTRALEALTLFFAVFVVGYRLELSKRAAARLARIGGGARRLDLRWVIAVCMIVGLGGEAIVLAKIGGIGTAVSQLGTQGNLSVSFTWLVILNAYAAGLLIWVCWHTPSSRLQKILFGLATAELMGFYALLGSRTLVLVPLLIAVVASNELIRPWPIRTLGATAVVILMFAAGYLAVREDSQTRSLGSAISSIPKYAVNVQAILNSSPVFDQFLEETNYIPRHAPYRDGGELAQGLLGQLPRFITPTKPEATDVTFRKLIWGSEFLAGRPVGAAGESYRDFGFYGILFGGLLLGFLARALTGLRARAGPYAGRHLRTCLFVVGVLLLFQFLVGSYSLVFGETLEIGIPLFVGLTLFARSR